MSMAEVIESIEREALTVDETHVMENGVIVRSGGAELVEEINSNGFAGV